MKNLVLFILLYSSIVSLSMSASKNTVYDFTLGSAIEVLEAQTVQFNNQNIKGDNLIVLTQASESSALWSVLWDTTILGATVNIALDAIIPDEKSIYSYNDSFFKKRKLVTSLSQGFDESTKGEYLDILLDNFKNEFSILEENMNAYRRITFEFDIAKLKDGLTKLTTIEQINSILLNLSTLLESLFKDQDFYENSSYFDISIIVKNLIDQSEAYTGRHKSIFVGSIVKQLSQAFNLTRTTFLKAEQYLKYDIAAVKLNLMKVPIEDIKISIQAQFSQIIDDTENQNFVNRIINIPQNIKSVINILGRGIGLGLTSAIMVAGSPLMLVTPVDFEYEPLY